MKAIVTVSISVSLLWAVATLAHSAEPVRRALLGGRLSMLVPADFQPMSQEMLTIKYPAASAPKYVLTSEDTTVNIAFDVKPVAVKPEQVPQLEVAMRQRLGTSKVISSGVKKFDGTDFAVLEFDSPAIDGTIRNVLAMTALDGQLLMVSYNCLLSGDAGCGVLGKRLIESLSLRKP